MKHRLGGREKLSVALAALALLTGFAPRAQAGTICVTPDGTGSGVDWANATSLTNALRISQSNDALWLAQGTYTNSATFAIASNGVALYGGFTNGMATFGERNWTNYPAILDGNSNNWRVVTVSANNAVVLDGLTITNSYGTSAGGLTKTTAGSLTLANCRIVDHTANNGGGVYVNNGALLMTNCVVAGNKAYSSTYAVYGYGVYAYGATAEIVDCLFSNQTYGNAWNNRDGYAAGLYMQNGNVQHTVFIDNRAANQVRGGAVSVRGTASISNCVFRGNSIDPASGGIGGALHVQGTLLNVVNCTFSGNTNAGNGGAVYLESGTLNLKNCILWTNSVKSGGTGYEIYKAGGTLTVSHSALPGQSVPYVYGSTSLFHCVSANPLFASAGDLHLRSPAGRWDPGAGVFVTSDSVYSPCIDTGDPADSIGSEPTDNSNAIINMGAYGGTAQASKSPPPEAPLLSDEGSSVTYDRAEISGALTNPAYLVARVYLCYGTGAGGAATGGWATVVELGNNFTGEVFSAWTPTLSASTTYHYRWFATNVAGWGWTEDNTFLTGAAAAGGGADVIHVDQTATGAADGTSWPHAFTTINSAITAISGSRTNIWITGGHYAEGLRLNLGTSATIIGGFAGTESTVAQRAQTNALGIVTNYTAIDGEGSHGCLYISAGNAWLDTLTFSNALMEGNAYGAFRWSSSGSLVANNCRVVKNTSPNAIDQMGIGVRLTAGAVLVTNCLVAENVPVNYGADGQGVYASGVTTLDIVDCVISNNNSAGRGFNVRDVYGGGLYFNTGTLRVRKTDFIDNEITRSWGGAVYLGNPTLATFSNCVFRGNDATYVAGGGGAGAGIYQANGTLQIVNCTFYDNSNNQTNGGAFYVAAGTLTMRNSILWSNRVTATACTGSEIYNAAGTVTVTYSDLTGTNSPHVTGSATFGNCLTSAPLFASTTDLHLQSRGGRWDPATRDFVMVDSDTSPCIDMGDPTDSVGSETEPNGGYINMGAYGGTAQASRSGMPQGTLFIFQ